MKILIPLLLTLLYILLPPLQGLLLYTLVYLSWCIFVGVYYWKRLHS